MRTNICWTHDGGLLQGPHSADEETNPERYRDSPGRTARGCGLQRGFIYSPELLYPPHALLLHCSFLSRTAFWGLSWVLYPSTQLLEPQGDFWAVRRPGPELVNKAKYFTSFVKSVYTQAYYWLLVVNCLRNEFSLLDVQAESHCYIRQLPAVFMYHSVQFTVLPDATPVPGLVLGPRPPRTRETISGQKQSWT